MPLRIWPLLHWHFAYQPGTKMAGVFKITEKLWIPWSELQFRTMRSGGPGGQHVNKVSTAVQLSLDVSGSSLPDEVKRRILSKQDRYLTGKGEIIIKVDQFRHQNRNRREACRRLRDYIVPFTIPPKKRKATRRSRSSVEKRLQKKKQRSEIKNWRKKPPKDYRD